MTDNGQNALQKLDAATRMLAEIKTVSDAKKVINLSAAAKEYAKKAKLGLAAQNHAAAIHIKAQYKLGEILERLERGSAGRPDKNSGSVATISEYRQILEETNTSIRDAGRAQQIRSVPEKTILNILETMRENQNEITTTAVLREVQAQRRENHNGHMERPNMPSGKYRVFYADPPWRYNDSGVVTDTDAYGRAERHYPTMSIDELCSLPIKEMAEDDAVLFLWVTSPMLEDSFKIIKAWGFEYKTSFVWDKVRHNFGHYNSVRHEFLLVCTRGRCTPDHLQLFDSVQSIERTDEHSQKPAEFRAIIDTLYTHGNKIELFAREAVEGWQGWGNEYAAVEHV